MQVKYGSVSLPAVVVKSNCPKRKGGKKQRHWRETPVFCSMLCRFGGWNALVNWVDNPSSTRSCHSIHKRWSFMHADIKLVLGGILLKHPPQASLSICTTARHYGHFSVYACMPWSVFLQYICGWSLKPGSVHFFFLRFGNDVIQLIFLNLKIIFPVGKYTLEPVDLFCFGFQCKLKFTDPFFGKLYFKALDLYLLREWIVFTIVPYVHLLFFIFLDQGLGILDGNFFSVIDFSGTVFLEIILDTCFNPAISSSRSWTSSGNSPRMILILSTWESICWRLYRAISFFQWLHRPDLAGAPLL